MHTSYFLSFVPSFKTKKSILRRISRLVNGHGRVIRFVPRDIVTRGIVLLILRDDGWHRTIHASSGSRTRLTNTAHSRRDTSPRQNPYLQGKPKSENRYDGKDLHAKVSSLESHEISFRLVPILWLIPFPKGE